MQLRAIIVDDEKKGISALKQLMEKFIDDVRVIAECSKAPQAIDLIESLKPEIVFLDINMPGMNGFDILDGLGWKNFNLVFITAHQDYALKALKNNAIDYLLKPVGRQDLEATIRKIRDKAEKDEVTITFNYKELFSSIHPAHKSRLLVNSGSDIESVEISDIICLESKSNYTKICVSHGKEIMTRKTLKEFEFQLCHSDSYFMRVHHSYIINLHRVIRYLKAHDNIIMSGDLKIPVSKGRRDLFLQWLNI